MDVLKAIRELHEELSRVDAMIAVLEERVKSTPRASQSKRGRKKMSRQERLQISERMRKYWANRRSEVPVAIESES